jgi:DNA-binding FadR family transcriptional regulator
MTYCPTRRVITAHDMDVDIVYAHRPAAAPHLFDVAPAGARPHRPGPHAGQALERDHNRAQLETVALLEAAAIALGASGLTAESIRSARAADHELRRCRSDLRTAVRWARLFHRTLLAACPNRHVLGLLDAEAMVIGPAAWPRTIGVDELTRTADDHDAILDMIAVNTPRAELERALRRHAHDSLICVCVAHP